MIMEKVFINYQIYMIYKIVIIDAMIVGGVWLVNVILVDKTILL